MIVGSSATCKILEFGDLMTPQRAVRGWKMNLRFMQTLRVMLEVLIGFWCDGESLGDGGSELMGMDG